MVHGTPREWAKWIPLAEWWYNIIFHSATHTTPYEIVYGQLAPIHMPYLLGDSCVETLDKSLQACEAAIKLLKFYLSMASNHMKQQADKK